MADIETIKTLVPAPVEMPRGALWAATAALWIWNGVRRIAARRRVQRISPPSRRTRLREQPCGT